MKKIKLSKRTIIICFIAVFLVVAFILSTVKQEKSEKTSSENNTIVSEEENDDDFWEEMKAITKKNTVTFIILGISCIAYVGLKIHEKKKEQLIHEDSMIFTEVMDEETEK